MNTKQSIATTSKGHVKVSSLSDFEYSKLRRKLVATVNKSDSQTIKDVAGQHNISHSTLWSWCVEDLGPNQFKWLQERSRELRGKRISKSLSSQPSPTPCMNKQKEAERILNAPNMNDKAKQALLLIKGITLAPKNKPWDKKKAREAHQATIQAAYNAVMDPTPTLVKSVTLPSVLRKTLGPHVTINLSPDGKLVKYEVTGDVNVVVFTQTEATTNRSVK